MQFDFCYVQSRIKTSADFGAGLDFVSEGQGWKLANLSEMLQNLDFC